MNLPKSLYTKSIQCQKALWLKKYNKEVQTPPDEIALARFKTGNEVENLACELFPNYLSRECNNFFLIKYILEDNG